MPHLTPVSPFCIARIFGSFHISPKSHIPFSAGKKVFCYFSSSSNARGGIGKFWPENIDPYLCTHLIFAFADIAEGGKGLEPNNWNDLGKHGMQCTLHVRSTTAERYCHSKI